MRNGSYVNRRSLLNAAEVNKNSRFAIISSRDWTAIGTGPGCITQLFADAACDTANQPVRTRGRAATTAAQQTAAGLSPVGRAAVARTTAGGFLALTRHGVANLACGAILVRNAVGAVFTLSGIGVAHLSRRASHTTIQTAGCLYACHGVITNFAFFTIGFLGFRRTLTQRNTLSLTVATATAFAPGATCAVGITGARLRGLFDALVGKSVANEGFAIIAGASPTIGAVVALAGWVLANAILANQTFSTVTLGRTIGIPRLAVAIHTILTGRASGGVSAAHLTKSGIGAV